jgi:TonB family protein
METLTPADAASTSTEPELHLWFEEDNVPRDWSLWRKAAVLSAAFHVVLILALLIIPDTPANPLPEPNRIVHRVTPLYIPPELTQKAPNKGKLDKDLRLESIAPHPTVKIPAPAAPAKRVQAAAPTPPPAAPVAQIAPKPVIVEPPPKIEEPTPQPAQIAKLVAPPPPPPPPQVEPPKLALEQVAPPPPSAQPQGPRAGFPAIPNTSVEAAIHNLARSGSQAGLTVGDDVSTSDTNLGSGLNLPPSAGRQRSSLQLKSDPMGVDFQPYLIQVLAAIRRNWFAVYPEAARQGARGTVTLQFAVEKQGRVAKIVYGNQSGAKPLDESAIAAVSASNPLPPLPLGFKGDRIVLQMTFLYNMPR